MEKNMQLLNAIADVGRKNPLSPPMKDIKAFSNFFANGRLDVARLDDRDGSCLRRELLVRFLLLCAVLDQGPDISGVRQMMAGVINRLYEDEIRIFHSPLAFFRKMHVSVKEIWDNHEAVKAAKADEWAERNQTNPDRYNLFMDGGKQSLSYAIFRWGTPLALPYLLSQKAGKAARPTALIDYLEQSKSAEAMSARLKDDNMYGLGKAIGDKACHLFAKWIVSTFSLTRRDDSGWGKYSFEVPYDSNAGRVLWRTGYLLRLADEGLYKQKQVVQPNAGAGGRAYIRVTNIRGVKATCDLSDEVKDAYRDICVDHLKTHKRGPKTWEIQRLQHAFLKLSDRGVAEFDDGLIHVGREYCHNHDQPDCSRCPLKKQCEGASSRPDLIKKYRT